MRTCIQVYTSPPLFRGVVITHCNIDTCINRYRRALYRFYHWQLKIAYSDITHTYVGLYLLSHLKSRIFNTANSLWEKTAGSRKYESPFIKSSQISLGPVSCVTAIGEVLRNIQKKVRLRYLLLNGKRIKSTSRKPTQSRINFNVIFDMFDIWSQVRIKLLPPPQKKKFTSTLKKYFPPLQHKLTIKITKAKMLICLFAYFDI